VNNIFILSLTIILSLLLQTCDQRADSNLEIPKKQWVFEEADSFLQYINTQASLGAGEYELVVATQNNNQVGDYSIEINVNGENKLLIGVWSPSAGLSADPDLNPSHRVVLAHAGGLTTKTNSNTNSYLYLLKNGYLVAEGKELKLPISQINSQAYTDAYYRAVDPEGKRNTLSAWQRVNGFDKGHDVHVIFRDTKDLGYGRNMYARKDKQSGNISFFVQNYAANLGGYGGQYNFSNVIAAINEMSEYHIGTNAIEFSPIDPTDNNSEKILKFFTFRREEGSSIEYRQDTANLDGRGEKQMPIPCLVCHGARLLPLNEDGEFQLLSLKSAKLNQLEVDSFEFANSGIFRQEAIESDIKIINEYVNEVYAEIGNQNRENFDQWSSDFALELSEGRYGGEGFPEATYQSDFIPAGWQQNIHRPDGVEQLFTDVIQPHCISCHSIRGSAAAERNNAANDINFSTYEKFISYNDKLIDYVFHRGIMPLSLLNFNKFWSKPEAAPALLASFLNGFTAYDENNIPMKPGRAFAKPGENRSALSPVQLNGSASLYARSFQWSIVSKPPASIASFNNAQIPNPVFSADSDGAYVLQLTVQNNLGNHSKNITITIDNSILGLLDKHQSELTFVDDIMENIMGASSEAPNTCANCHRSNTAHSDSNPLYDNKYDGIPVFYTLYDDSNNINLNLYRHVRARVDLADPENSLLLLKPTGNHHGGDVQINRNTLAGERDYQILLNWIFTSGTFIPELACKNCNTIIAFSTLNKETETQLTGKLCSDF